MLTFDLDDSSSYVLDLSLIKLDDVFGWVEFASFPDHGACYCWSELVWGGEGRIVAL